MKNIFRTILGGFGVSFGYYLGAAAVNALMDPVKRSKAKRKVKRIKNAIFKKEGS